MNGEGPQANPRRISPARSLPRAGMLRFPHPLHRRYRHTMDSENRYVIAGGSGMLGQALALSLASDSAQVVILTRHPRDYRGPLAAGCCCGIAAWSLTHRVALVSSPIAQMAVLVVGFTLTYAACLLTLAPAARRDVLSVLPARVTNLIKSRRAP